MPTSALSETPPSIQSDRELAQVLQFLADSSQGSPFSFDQQMKLADVLRAQVTPDTPQKEVEGILMQLIAQSHNAFLNQFSDIGARVNEEGRLQVLDGDAALDTTIIYTLDGAAAFGAVQMLQEQDPELAERFEQFVANILTA